MLFAFCKRYCTFTLNHFRVLFGRARATRREATERDIPFLTVLRQSTPDCTGDCLSGLPLGPCGLLLTPIRWSGLPMRPWSCERQLLAQVGLSPRAAQRAR